MKKLNKKTQLVGVLNCTPDSYFDKSRHPDAEEAIAYGLKLFEEGADIVDIGGESTRPTRSKPVCAEEELKRVIPVIKGIRKQSARPLSIDTYKPMVAEAALDAGADIINDITGGSDPAMRALAAKSGAPIIVMHMKEGPHTEPEPTYPGGVVNALLAFFHERVSLLVESGVARSQIILDPGIGGGAFGKTPEQCLQILNNLQMIRSLGFPFLVGLSRKSFLQKILQKEASELLSTTLALNTMAALEGVDYIRVHDVKQHREILTLLEYMNKIE